VASHGTDAEIRLEIPANANFSGLTRVLAQLKPLLVSPENDEPRLVVVDMRDVERCSATGITILAAALEHLFVCKRLRPGSQILAPQRSDVTQFLWRMNFFAELGVNMPGRQARARPHGFRPVTHVANDAESPAVTRGLVEAVEESYEIDPITSSALKSCVNEVVENVFYHARSPVDALVSVQTEDRKVELAIVDTGRGIRTSLLEVPEYRAKAPNDCSAIRLALKKNVTTTGDDRRGIGLWVVYELVRRNEGQMLVLSNDGGVDITGEQLVDIEEYFWPGTLVAVEFDMAQPIDIREVYASGEFDDDSFDF
jgi:anti-sigma regulatory factor (Ser/Thr protein kinase)